jgi:hypothetical protein
MSTQNTKASKGAFGSWKTLIDPEDRKSSECRTVGYMSKEEIEEKYGGIKNNYKRPMTIHSGIRNKKNESEDNDMGSNKEKKITREQLLEEAKKLGTSKNAMSIIATKYGMKASTIDFYLSTWGVRREVNNIEAEKLNKKNDGESSVEGEDPTEEVKTEKIEVKGDREMIKETEVKELQPALEKRVSTLKPKVLVSTMTNMMYELSDQAITVSGNGDLQIGFDKLDSVIAELQEIKKLA